MLCKNTIAAIRQLLFFSAGCNSVYKYDINFKKIQEDKIQMQSVTTLLQYLMPSISWCFRIMAIRNNIFSMQDCLS